MAQPDDFQGRVVALPLHSREIRHPKGTSVEFAVPCARRGAYAPLQTCLSCDSCEGIQVGVNESDIEVSCSSEEALDPGRAGRAKGGRAETVPVSAIMTGHVICVHPELPLDELASVLLENGIGAAPVVDVAGRPLGIASKTDLLRWFRGGAQAAERGTVADIMTPLTFVLPAAESIAKAAALMTFEHVHQVPIVAASGQVVGIVTSHDILTWLARSCGYIVQPTTRV